MMVSPDEHLDLAVLRAERTRIQRRIRTLERRIERKLAQMDDDGKPYWQHPTSLIWASELPDTPVRGVYALVHRPTGQRYVGSSEDVRARVNWHCSHLTKGSHPTRTLQRLWSTTDYSEWRAELLEVVTRQPHRELFRAENRQFRAVQPPALLLNAATPSPARTRRRRGQR